MHPDLQVDSTFEHQTADLRDDQFALVGYDSEGNKHRRFPVHNDEAVKRANFDFACFRSKLSTGEKQVAAHFIKQASVARRINVDPMVDLAAGNPVKDNNIGYFDDYVEPVQKQASSFKSRVSAINGRYPIDTPDLVKQACDYFEGHAMEFPTDTRRQYATNTQRQADILGVKTTPTIQKYASQTFDDHLKLQLKQRARIRPEAREDYEKLAAYAGSIPVDDFAQVLGELDQKHSLNRLWNKAIKDPLDATLGMPKEAAGWSTTIDGRVFTEQDLQKACESEEVKDLFGPDAEDFKQTYIFDSLPTPTKKIILTYV